jgi:hypothetical protein
MNRQLTPQLISQSLTSAQKLRKKEQEMQMAADEAEAAWKRRDYEQQQRFEEHQVKLAADMEKLKEGNLILQQKEAAIALAEQKRAGHSGKRGLKRALYGVLGTVAVVASGGLAAPLVAGAAIGTEYSHQKEKKKDLEELERARSG